MIVDVTHTFSFLLMLGAAMFMKPKWDFATSLSQALEAAKQGKDMVIILGRAQSATRQLYACLIERGFAEAIAELIHKSVKDTPLERDSLALAGFLGEMTSRLKKREDNR